MSPSREIPGQDALFPTDDLHTGAAPRFAPLTERLWTRNKAQLIAKYLREFVFVTKHGTYIDLFAGPQRHEQEDSWSVEQVLLQQLDSFHLNHYWLFEQDPAKVDQLRVLRDAHSGVHIEVNDPCDSNEAVPRVLPVGTLAEKEATFCLIDQRTTECEWATVQHLATMKPGRYKPEIFYFLAQSWLNRTLKTRTTDGSIAKTDRWWGSSQWRHLTDKMPHERALEFATRFTSELGYKSAIPWPIYDRKGGSTIMFHMIHATDHDRAPSLMRSAYTWAVAPKALESEEQLSLRLGDIDY
jgi:three-Cys-motif partner protein